MKLKKSYKWCTKNEYLQKEYSRENGKQQIEKNGLNKKHPPQEWKEQKMTQVEEMKEVYSQEN